MMNVAKVQFYKTSTSSKRIIFLIPDKELRLYFLGRRVSLSQTSALGTLFVVTLIMALSQLTPVL